MEKFILGCDWGTSSFRLRLLDLQEEQILGEVFSNEGVASIHNIWEKEIGQENLVGKKELFRQRLKKQIAVLSGKLCVDLDGVPVLISGMVSSSIGMEDVPYAMVPFCLDGSEAITKHFEFEDGFPHEIILISGVRSEKDVMRGEETQLIGVLELLALSGNKPLKGTMIFPGTHSKHVYIENNRLINFRTFMTGELFNVVCNYTILKNSVEQAGLESFSTTQVEAFKLGLIESRISGILNGLFTVRTNQLFNRLNKHQNFYYLSGLLIGSELNYLIEADEMPLLLCSGSNLYDFYNLALSELGLFNRTTVVANDLVDKAAVIGQKLIFETHKIKEGVK